MPRRLVHDGLVGLHRGGDPFGSLLPHLAGHMAESGGVGIEQDVRLLGAARDVVAEVAGVGQDGAHRRHGPGLAGSMRVAQPVVRRRTRDPFVGEHGGDLLVPRTRDVHLVDAPHDGRCQRVGSQLMEPGARGRLGRVRVGSEISDQVAVGRTPTEPAAGLGVGPHGVGDAQSGPVAFGSAHGAVVGEGHVVPVVVDVDRPA